MTAAIATPWTTASEPDLALLARFIDNGDPAAFASIVGRYGNLVYAAAIRVLGDPGGAQDVSQETFFRLMKEPRSVTRSLAGWLHRSATHLALDVRRSELSRHRRENAFGRFRAESSLTEPTWAEVSPIVDAAINELDEEDRLLIVRHFLHGVQQADLATELDVSPATVSRRIKSAVSGLRDKLQSRGLKLCAAGLAAFLIEQTSRKAPASLVSEMAKMQLVASIRSPVVCPPPVNFPATFTGVDYTRPQLSPDRTSLVYLGIAVLLALLVATLAVTWAHANSRVPPTALPVPSATAPDDR